MKIHMPEVGSFSFFFQLNETFFESQKFVIKFFSYEKFSLRETFKNAIKAMKIFITYQIKLTFLQKKSYVLRT